MSFMLPSKGLALIQEGTLGCWFHVGRRGRLCQDFCEGLEWNWLLCTQRMMGVTCLTAPGWAAPLRNGISCVSAEKLGIRCPALWRRSVNQVESLNKFWRQIRGSNPDGSECHSALQSLKRSWKEAKLEKKDPILFFFSCSTCTQSGLYTVWTPQQCDVDGCFAACLLYFAL